MMKLLKKLMENQKKRTALIICSLCILVAAVLVFIGFELKRNQSLYVNNFIENQQRNADQIAIQFQHYIENQGLSVNSAIVTILDEVDTTGNSYWFVAMNDDLLFVKDKVTSDTYEFTSLTSFLKVSKSEGYYLVYQNFAVGDTEYTIGNCITKSYIKDDGQLYKHLIYVVMPLILLTAIVMVVVIYCILIINRQESKIKGLSMEAIDRNVTIELLTTRLKKAKFSDHGGVKGQDADSKEKQIYNKEVLVSLLAKINRENIVPLTMVIIELSSKNRIYTAQEYQGFVRSATDYLLNEHVIAEIIPGIFSILMFHSGLESKNELKKTLINEWAIPLKKNGIKIRLGITCIENYDSNVENVFDIVYKEVSGRESERIRLTS